MYYLNFNVNKKITIRKVTIIAEAGVNHNGNLEIAKQLIRAASDAKVEYVKFQTFKTENLVSKSAQKASYQKENVRGGDTQFDMLKKLELSSEDHLNLNEYCKMFNVKFLSTAFDHDSIDFLKSLELGLWKIPSGEITNKPYLEHIASFGEDVILSTGMSTLEEIGDALEVLYNQGLTKNKITVLHCTSSYPTPFDQVNLRAMKTIENEFGVSIGYSDHTLGIEVPIAAVALGATVIEKHFTLDRSMEGPDHLASLEPNELIAMCRGIRNVSESLGSSVKQPTAEELDTLKVARKSIHSRHFIAKGRKIEMNDLQMLRPGTGISPMKLDEIVGKSALTDIPKNTLISWDLVG